ncbi:hypothetical protein ACRAWF_38770 [Streptomyces sp. L7]
MTNQPVFVLGEELQALERAEFETEAEFQELLARHPRVLDFGSLADGRPLRLVLVAREMGVPTSTDSAPAYWLDHLFVDADGVPTLVEVKRATDSRIRREVVGQMLDYAANAARYWPAALLRRSFEDTCAKDGRSLEEAYGELLGDQDDRSAEEFWTTVEERLAAGQMRLLFVADRIPLELRAIVEFLNRQLRQTDVYAVELTQYRGGGDLRVLVPRVHGEVATAAKSPRATARRSGPPAPTWTRRSRRAPTRTYAGPRPPCSITRRPRAGWSAVRPSTGACASTTASPAGTYRSRRSPCARTRRRTTSPSPSARSPITSAASGQRRSRRPCRASPAWRRGWRPCPRRTTRAGRTSF